MPFFGSRQEPSPEPVVPVYEEPPKKHGFFGRRDASDEALHQQQPAYQEPPKKHGLFSRGEPSRETVQQPVYEEPPKKHGLFGRRDPSPTPTASTRATGRTSLSSASMSTFHTAGGQSEGGGLFRRGTDASSATNRRGMLRRSFGHGNGGFDDDPSVLDARQRVQNAEAMEREADRALDEARSSVREAREQVKRLEEEAREEARRAKIKQHQAREVSKLGKALGRHGP
ncbi:hypothetical protein EDB81DRAFT_783948 [Dactylonectria macrodidyma]|uniref:Uncharacterized protein n=1 Tax=Dactylonectria macrodidyma TaxID=307937 RepID=A0A9P9FGM2_9HYPO|nr:hypothetical protein EDB81DRAFT_783948 [Dactylonectria macrodidyma]